MGNQSESHEETVSDKDKTWRSISTSIIGAEKNNENRRDLFGAGAKNKRKISSVSLLEAEKKSERREIEGKSSKFHGKTIPRKTSNATLKKDRELLCPTDA